MSERNEFFQTIVDLADLSAVIGDDTELTKVGGKMFGWHVNHPSDSKKSLVIYPDKGWYCFNCEQGGSVLDYVMDTKKMLVNEAVSWLCNRFQIPNPSLSPEEQAELKLLKSEKAIISKLYLAALEYYAESLSADQKDHLVSRGLTEESIDKFKIGYADGKLWSYLVKRYPTIQAKHLLWTGLFKQFDDGRTSDIFTNRYIFPYFKHEKPVYFIGRRTAVSDTEIEKLPKWNQMKYRKLPIHGDNYPYISKTVNNDIFLGEDSAWDNDSGIVAEGVLDCILAIQHGYSCISPATTHFSQDQFERLYELAHRWSTINIIFDTDESGKTGAAKVATSLFKRGCDTRVVNLPVNGKGEKMDLADFLKGD